MRSAAKAQAAAVAEERLLAQMPSRKGVLRTENYLRRQEEILITRIQPNPAQPRRHFGEADMEELVGSIRAQGLLQPIRLWQIDVDRYQVIAGERRWRAFARLADEPVHEDHNPADYQRIPAIITELKGGDAEARSILQALVENVVRADLRDGERADALVRLKKSTGWTWESLADRMGLTVNRVQELAVIARHEPVRDAVNEGRLTQKQGIAVGRLADAELAAELVLRVPGLSEQETAWAVREAAQLAADMPSTERARRAVDHVTQGVAVIGALPSADRRETLAIRSNGHRVGSIHRDIVVLTNTSLRAVRPRVTEMDRQAFAAMLQAVCVETNIWPRGPRPGSSTRTGAAKRPSR